MHLHYDFSHPSINEKKDFLNLNLQKINSKANFKEQYFRVACQYLFIVVILLA